MKYRFGSILDQYKHHLMIYHDISLNEYLLTLLLFLFYLVSRCVNHFGYKKQLKVTPESSSDKTSV